MPYYAVADHAGRAEVVINADSFTVTESGHAVFYNGERDRMYAAPFHAISPGWAQIAEVTADSPDMVGVIEPDHFFAQHVVEEFGA